MCCAVPPSAHLVGRAVPVIPLLPGSQGGDVIKTIREATGAKIKVEEPNHQHRERIINLMSDEA